MNQTRSFSHLLTKPDSQLVSLNSAQKSRVHYRFYEADQSDDPLQMNDYPSRFHLSDEEDFLRAASASSSTPNKLIKHVATSTSELRTDYSRRSIDSTWRDVHADVPLRQEQPARAPKYQALDLTYQYKNGYSVMLNHLVQAIRSPRYKKKILKLAHKLGLDEADVQLMHHYFRREAKQGNLNRYHELLMNPDRSARINKYKVILRSFADYYFEKGEYLDANERFGTPQYTRFIQRLRNLPLIQNNNNPREASEHIQVELERMQ